MKLLYEDKEIIVCEKPAGTASQNERGFTADMVSLLMTHEKESGVKQPYIGVVHRLDKMVGGVMVYAKNKSAAANLSKQIAQHKVKKKYYAIVMGIPETQNGVMEDYLVRDGRTNTSGIAGKNEKDAKPAKLEYRVLKTNNFRGDRHYLFPAGSGTVHRQTSSDPGADGITGTSVVRGQKVQSGRKNIAGIPEHRVVLASAWFFASGHRKMDGISGFSGEWNLFGNDRIIFC